LFQWMARWQCGERCDKIPNLFIVGLDTYASTELLQQIDARPPVRRIHHEVHRPIRVEYAAQSAEPRIRIRKMMENPGAENLIEARCQLVDPLDGELADMEIGQVVLLLELLGTAHTGCAEVDTDNLSRRPAQRMLGGLRCPAASNEDGVVVPIGSCRPEEVIVHPAFL